jgi:hypothetical protein
MIRAEPKFKPLPPECVAALDAGKLIDAVKALRASRGLGLKEAKDWVDWHIEQNPALYERLATQQREIRRKVFMWFLLIDAVIVAGVIYWFFFRGAH